MPYQVSIPYAIIELDKDFEVNSIKEKPNYSYQANAGIYLIKADHLKLIPAKGAYDMTELMKLMIRKKMKVISCPVNGYWRDIGAPEEYRSAQSDTRHLEF